MTTVPSSAAAHEEEVKRAAELKEWLEAKISELELELLRTRDMMAIVDATLRKSSFVPAAILRGNSEASQERIVKEPQLAKELERAPTPSQDQPRTLRRTKDGKVLASAYVDSEKIVIVPDAEIKFAQITPPFQSFFLNRILKGFRTKDEEQSKSGSLPSEQVLDYKVLESDGNISSITITNYRERVRLNEILSTATWAFTRMLEKR